MLSDSSFFSAYVRCTLDQSTPTTGDRVLREDNRLLHEQLGDPRLQLTNDQRRPLRHAVVSGSVLVYNQSFAERFLDPMLQQPKVLQLGSAAPTHDLLGRMTIINAIKEVMRRKGSPLTAHEAYEAIVAAGLYEFHAQSPEHVVLQQIRRHCQGIDFPTASTTKHFERVGTTGFWPLDKIISVKRPGPSPTSRRHEPQPRRTNSLSTSLAALQALHSEYLRLLRDQLATEVRDLSPSAFEAFSRALLQVYGFENTQVTAVSHDGGIDGHGKLRVGLAYLNVAFQCKRWRKGNIQRPEIDRFRGASQGEFEQGIFFATTSFSHGAIEASVKKGAIPIVLIDLDAIVDLMIQKEFGVQFESILVPPYALDLALRPSDEIAADAAKSIPSTPVARSPGNARKIPLSSR